MRISAFGTDGTCADVAAAARMIVRRLALVYRW
jgi:hypothetical protein